MLPPAPPRPSPQPSAIDHCDRLFPPGNRHLEDRFGLGRPARPCPSSESEGRNEICAVEKRGIFGDRTMLIDAKVRTAKPRPKAYKARRRQSPLSAGHPAVASSGAGTTSARQTQDPGPPALSPRIASRGARGAGRGLHGVLFSRRGSRVMKASRPRASLPRYNNSRLVAVRVDYEHHGLTSRRGLPPSQQSCANSSTDRRVAYLETPTLQSFQQAFRRGKFQ
jgi:hypothetical protein